jgi:hypothetical protein
MVKIIIEIEDNQGVKIYTEESDKTKQPGYKETVDSGLAYGQASVDTSVPVEYVDTPFDPETGMIIPEKKEKKPRRKNKVSPAQTKKRKLVFKVYHQLMEQGYDRGHALKAAYQYVKERT